MKDQKNTVWWREGSMRSEKNPTNSDTEAENPYHINSSGIPQKEPLKIHSSDPDHIINDMFLVPYSSQPKLAL